MNVLDSYNRLGTARKDFFEMSEMECTEETEVFEDDEILKVPVFPVDVFPLEISEYLLAASKSVACPVDFLGTFALAMFSSIIGSFRKIAIKKDWKEPALVYTAVVAPPSVKKSPALSKVIFPVEAKQAEYKREFEKEKLEYFRDQENRPRPILKQLYTVDSTIEALAEILGKQTKGILFKQDEISGWVRGMGQYKGGKGNDLAYWLSIWSCSPTIINRKKQEPIILEKPFVSVTGGIQPELVKELNSAEQDGFINRILFSYPEIEKTAWVEYEIPEAIKDNYFNKCYQLIDAFEEFNEIEDVDILRVSSRAKECFKNYHNELVNLAWEEENTLLKASLSKLIGYTGRFALIIQLAHDPKSELIELDTMQKAVKLCNYFKRHLYKTFSLLSQNKQTARILKAIKYIRNKDGEIFIRDIYKNNVCGCNNRKDAQDLINELKRNGFGDIKLIPPPNGGRPKAKFVLFD